MKDASALPRSASLVVQPSWIDLYGHMNASRYFTAFIEEGFALMDGIGVGSSYTEASGCGTFVVRAHIQYFSELRTGAPLHIRLRVVQVDHVRLRLLLELVDEAAARVAACFEQLLVHVDLATRRARSFPEAVRAGLAGLVLAHADVPLPKGFKESLHG